MRLLIFMIVLSAVQGIRNNRNRYHSDPRRSLVLFLNSNGTVPQVAGENARLCGGAFVTRQHVLTTLQCALWSKRHHLVPLRLHYFGTSMSSPYAQVVSGKVTYDAVTQKVCLLDFEFPQVTIDSQVWNYSRF